MDKWITIDNRENKDRKITEDGRTLFKCGNYLQYQRSSTGFATLCSTSDL